jgi:hypothetical protein
MGINPGEDESQWRDVPGPTEETWNHDFHEMTERSRPSTNWYNNVRFFADGSPVVMTEMFFWSAKRDEFRRRFGRLQNSPHLIFCVSMNRILIDEYQPKMIILPGITSDTIAANAFRLNHVRTYRPSRKRLVEHYRDATRPWFFTRHWSGDIGLSNEEKIAMKEYIYEQS